MANPSLPAQKTRLQNDSVALEVDNVIINGKVVLYQQQALVADASTAHSFNATFSNTELQNAANALGTKINAILTILKNHGLMADA